MSLELVAVEGCEFEAVSGVLDFGGAFSVLTSANEKNKAQGNSIYFGPIDVNVSAMVNGDLAQVAPVVFTISPGATKLSDSISFAMLEGNSETQTVSFTDIVTGSNADVAITVSISDAGQDRVYAQ